MQYLECNVADCDGGTLYCTACAPAFAASAARTCKSCWRRHISDDMWRLYLTRVFSANDARLRQAMFNTEFVRYLVHRHSIRTRQSYQNAVAASRAQGKALFIIQASDIAHEEDKAAFTDGMRRDLMLQSNPRHTKLLPSFLPLYVGMRLSLYSKDCVRLGHMNGCECILEKIVFSDLEDLPRRFTRKTCTRKLAKYLKSLRGKVPEGVLALFGPNAEEVEERQVREARAKAMNVTKHSRMNGTAQPAQELGGTKRRRITGKQAPPPWFLTLGLVLATVMASKRSASQMDLSGDGEGSAPKPGKLARGDIPSAQDACNPAAAEDPVIDEENGVAQGHEVT
jgi:hypothetical protein